ncbi:MAG: electron transport complex subunit RsxC [Ruminococcus sp.]|jgi:electron transport complex protein RnfC|nr:electron transport complex subunit RsxC [Ruminococcus sp.]
MKKLNCIRLGHNKNTENCPIVRLGIPESVRIPMSMNMGAACEPIVNVGDFVCVGQKIGDNQAFFSVPVHSGVSGTVTAISDYQLPSGNMCKAIEIQCDGKQTLCESVKSPVISDKASFIKAVRESGMVGLGGAGFPTHVKLSTDAKIDTLIINAAECEPYLTSDDRMMLEYPDELAYGIELISHMLDIPHVIIGIEDNKTASAELLTKKTANIKNTEVKVLPSLYPQGGEKIMIYNCTGRIVDEGKLPSDVGVIVVNVSTAILLARFFKTGMPLVERVLTVDGDTVGKSGNYLVPIGTSVSYVLENAQCNISKIKKLIMGGPMMGMTVFDINQPVCKANGAVLAMEKITENRESACIRCGRCVRACPINLMPTEIEKAYIRRDISSLQKLKVNLCINCGCCTYVCPSKRKLAETNQLAKAILPRTAK